MSLLIILVCVCGLTAMIASLITRSWLAAVGFLGVVLLGDRQPGAMLEDLADFELLEVEASPLSEAPLAELNVGRERKLGH